MVTQPALLVQQTNLVSFPVIMALNLKDQQFVVVCLRTNGVGVFLYVPVSYSILVQLFQFL